MSELWNDFERENFDLEILESQKKNEFFVRFSCFYYIEFTCFVFAFAIAMLLHWHYALRIILKLRIGCMRCCIGGS